MAINPNTTFVAGAVLTAAQQNRFPRGVMAAASSSTSFTLATSVTAIATGMTVTWTASASRIYKITYFEPSVETSTVSASQTGIQIRPTSFSTTQVAGTVITTVAAVKNTSGLTVTYILTAPTAGSLTYVGTAFATSITGAPVLNRSAISPAQFIVEDIGPA